MKLTPKQAAAIMGVCPEYIRIGLQQQRLPIGTAVKITSRWTYDIRSKKLAEYVGCTEEEIERRLK